MPPIELIDEMNGRVSCPPEFLYNRLKDGKWCVYIGSGVSIPACGSWSKLISELCSACGVTHLPEEVDSTQKLLDLADRALTANKAAYRDFLYNRLGPPLAVTTKHYEKIIRLPYHSCLTTNFDDGLASYYRTSSKNKSIGIYPNLDATDIRDRIFYLHGKIDSRDFNTNHLIFGTNSINQAYDENGPLSIFLKSVLLNNNLLVVGASLSEEPLKKLLIKINELSKAQQTTYGLPTREKIILLEQSSEIEAPSFSSMGFRVLRYANTGRNNHELLYEYLETVCKLHEGAAANFTQLQ